MSEIKVNTITPRSGTTLTLGGSGDTVTLAACASQSGFGRTGTVDWCTTAKTSPLTAVSGKGYFINTTGGAITVTLPSSPSAGDIVALKDYANTWDSNAVTVGRGGSKIGGECACATLNTESQSVTLIYVDGTKGWQDIHDSTSDVTGASFVAATGGTVATVCTNYKTHTFTSSGCFQVTSAGNSAGSNTVDYMVIAGGGGSGRSYGGGGGGGGFRESSGAASGGYSASPLGACVSALPVSVSTYPITVGGGGATASAPAFKGTIGSNSVFSTITSAGGGYGGGGGSDPGGNGGSGGGGNGPCSGATGGRPGGTGNTPPVSPAQGTNGVTVTAPQWGGAGGGATATGSVRAGGVGATTSISATPTGYAGGGGGGPEAGAGPQPGAASGTQGGGTYNTNGTANTGGGGGSDGGAGGSGIVMIRYRYQ